MGDLKYGRTVHSLIRALRKYDDNFFWLYSPTGLELPEELMGNDCFGVGSMEDVFREVPDVIYMTRIQEERMQPEQRGTFSYRIGPEFVNRLPHNAIVMHPLPRVGEMDRAVDSNPRVMPFKQVRYGVPTRMAIIATMLGHEEEIKAIPKEN
jgi:aspartate carbamoyltransferase catalytic subunit